MSRDRWFLAILALALALRLAAAAAFWDRPLHDDEQAYDAVARNLTAGLGFSTAGPIGLVNPGGNAPSSLWGCLQPLWVAAGYRLWGPVPGPIYLVNAVLGLLPVWAAARLGGVLAGRRAGRLAAAVVALDPYLVKFGASLLSETLYVALLWPALVLLERWAAGIGGVRAALASGFLLALASLTRAPAFYLALALAAWALLERRAARAGLRDLAREGAAFGLLLALGLAPWVWRNRLVHEPPVFLDTKAGWNLYSYLHPAFDPARATRPPLPREVLDPAWSESQRNQWLLARAREFAWVDPLRILSQAPAKLWLLWSPFPGPLTEPGLGPVKLAFVLPLELAALAGLLRVGARRPGARMILVLVGFHVVLHSVMTGGPRFRVPLDPALAALAGLSLFFRATPEPARPDGGSPHGDAERSRPIGGGGTGQARMLRV